MHQFKTEKWDFTVFCERDGNLRLYYFTVSHFAMMSQTLADEFRRTPAVYRRQRGWNVVCYTGVSG